MSIFLSWSGPRSKAVAESFKEQLALFEIDSWMSSEDISKGQSWLTEIGDKLDKYSGGIIFLTPENLEARWINFEAGAIAKHGNSSRVCTYLLDLDSSDVPPPLSFFQATKPTQEDTLKLFKDLKEWVTEGTVNAENIEKIFNAVAWLELDKSIDVAKKIKTGKPKSTDRDADEKIDELLGLMRSFDTNQRVYIESAIKRLLPSRSAEKRKLDSIREIDHVRTVLECSSDRRLGMLFKRAMIENQDAVYITRAVQAMTAMRERHFIVWNDLTPKHVLDKLIEIFPEETIRRLYSQLVKVFGDRIKGDTRLHIDEFIAAGE